MALNFLIIITKARCFDSARVQIIKFHFELPSTGKKSGN
jgi:hypothetical protein